MKISAKTDYACKALLELSLHWPNKEPLRINAIAKRQNIPIKFLTQILLILKQLGYVESMRGKSGGYTLNMTPKQIKLSSLIESFEGDDFNGSESRPHVMNDIYNEVDQVVFKTLDQINFETIVNRKKRYDNVVMFEI